MKNKVKINMERFGIPIKKKSYHRVKIFLLAIAIIAIIMIITFGIQRMIQLSINNLSVTNDLNAAWISSMASYWGGIIGGIISGLLAVIGVAWTIRYYRNSDVNRSRIENMPFLLAEYKGQSSQKTGAKKPYVIPRINEKSQNSSENKIYLNIELKNIGRGFASTLVIYTGENFGGIAYSEVLQLNESKTICLHVFKDDLSHTNDIRFGIRYIDCMTNEYIQMYTLKSDEQFKIDNGYPAFVCQTHTIGN